MPGLTPVWSHKDILKVVKEMTMVRDPDWALKILGRNREAMQKDRHLSNTPWVCPLGMWWETGPKVVKPAQIQVCDACQDLAKQTQGSSKPKSNKTLNQNLNFQVLQQL